MVIGGDNNEFSGVVRGEGSRVVDYMVVGKVLVMSAVLVMMLVSVMVVEVVVVILSGLHVRVAFVVTVVGENMMIVGVGEVEVGMVMIIIVMLGLKSW